MIRRPPRSTLSSSSAASDVYKRQEAAIVTMGWIFVPLMLLASALMTAVACLLNNVLRQYPVYWWSPEDVGRKLRKAQREDGSEEKADPNELEKQVSETDRYVYLSCILCGL